MLLGSWGLNSCSTVNAPKKDTPINIWLQEGLPREVCEKNPELMNYGVFRVVGCDDQKDPLCNADIKAYEEFVSYCSEQITSYLTIYEDELYDLLKQRAKNSN
jgi:hypothetical protein